MAVEGFRLRRWLMENGSVEINMASSSVAAMNLSNIGSIDTDFSLGYDSSIQEDLVGYVERIYEGDTSITLSPGAQMGNFLTYSSLFERGDEVLVESPGYEPLWTAVENMGCRVKKIHRRYEDGYGIDLERLKETISKDTKGIVLTNPHNPSGVFLSFDELKGLYEIAEDNNLWLIVDEIYRDFIEDSSSAVDLGPNVVATTSLSKVYGLGGLRMGWIASTDEALIDKIDELKIKINLMNSTLSEKVTIQLLERRDSILDKIRKEAENGRDLVRGWVHGSHAVDWVEPDPGIISFPRLDIDISAEEFAIEARKHGVLVAPGEYFTEGGELTDHIRLTFGKGFSSVAEGVRRLTRVLEGCKR